MNFYEKFEKIREAEGLSQSKLSNILEIKLKSYESAIYRKSEAKGEILRRICNQFPEYTLWLMTDIVQPENGQISPEIKLKTMELNKTQNAGY